MTQPQPPGTPGPDILERSPPGWLGRRWRWLAPAVAALLLAGGTAALVAGAGRHPRAHGGGPGAQTGTLATVCNAFVTQDSSAAQPGARIVLGFVALPPAYLPQVARSGIRSWPYWRKIRFEIRSGGSQVTISVPSGWRQRVAVTWGSYGIAGAVRIPGCPPTGLWNGYAGGFYLRSAAACVPLRIRAGPRSALVWFGLGRRCASAPA